MPAKLSDDRAIFAFAGGLCYSSAPPSKGFVLEIDGKEVLRFDVCHNDVWESRWPSADGRVELEFDSLRYTSGGDPVGVFYLKSRDVKLGQPCRLTVRSLGGGSGRWFGIHSYPDVK